MQDISASAASILTLVVVVVFLDSVIGEPKVLEYPFKHLSGPQVISSSSKITMKLNTPLQNSSDIKV